MPAVPSTPAKRPQPHAPVATAGSYYGVVEGFYGRPWTSAQRSELCARLAALGLNSYLYAPKDDLLHRACWREPYRGQDADDLSGLIGRCRRLGIRFIYGLAPGLKANDTPAAMERGIRRKLQHLHALGCRHFALLFDDIPSEGFSQHLRHYGSWAGAHVAWTHSGLEHLRATDPGVRFLFCPTPYCGSFAGDVSNNPYLHQVGESLASDVDVFWTGREIIPETIDAGEIRLLGRVIRRSPVIWDNLFANDYDLRRLHLGPYQGRESRLRGCVRGILINPNCEFEANFVPIETFSDYVRGGGCSGGGSYSRALGGWRRSFRTRDGSLPSLEEMHCLADILHLPHHPGPSASRATRDLDACLATGGRASRPRIRFLRFAEKIVRWQARIGELEDRELAYALYRHVWEAKEEVDLMVRYLDWITAHSRRAGHFRSVFHRLGTYRGGWVADLQRRLILHSDGSFKPAIFPLQPPSTASL